MSSSFDAPTKQYLVTHAGESYSSSTDITVVTTLTGTGAAFATTATASSKLAVTMSNGSATGLQRAFSFVIYAP